jgi:membrane protein required for colicin V production
MSDLPVTLFDLIVGGVVILSTLLALSRGAVREALGLATWIGAIIAAVYAFEHVRPMLLEALGNELLTDAATLAVVFFVPFFALRIVSGMIARAVSASALGPIDKFLGLGFGFARGALIVCAAYLVGSVIVAREQHPDWVKTAMLQPPVEQGADWLATLLPPGVLDASKDAAAEAAADAAERARRLREAGEGVSDGVGYADRARERMDELIRGRLE